MNPTDKTVEIHLPLVNTGAVKPNWFPELLKIYCTEDTRLAFLFANLHCSINKPLYKVDPEGIVSMFGENA